MRRKLFVLLISIVILAYGCSNSPGNKSADEKYNVLFIAIDDMNNWVGEFGGKAKTPNIDKLAQKGMKFTNAYCVVPACNPSRTALMTGQRPETTGQYNNAGNFRDRPGGKERITLPQFLQTKGYETVAAGKIFHQPRGSAVKQNYYSDTVSWNNQWVGNVGTKGDNLYLDKDGWAAWLQGAHLKYLNSAGGGGMNYMCRAGIWGPIPDLTEETGDWKMASFCADFLMEKHEKPFFLACGIFRPHSPQLAPQKYFDMYPLDEVELPVVPTNDMDDIPDIAQSNFSTPFVKLVHEKGEWKKAVQAYLACMTYADDCVGHIMDALSVSDYADNTIVVFWTDHGWQLGHKNRWEKYSLWRQGTNTPMVVYYPKMKNAGTECKRAVSFLDIYPTVLELLGEQLPDYLQGQSIVPLLEDPEAERDIPAVITHEAGNHSVVLDQWNYIQYLDGSEELYNHEYDLGEFTNLAGMPEFGEIIKKLKKFIPETPGSHLSLH